MIYHDKKGQENPWRKHHVSAVTRDIWLCDTQSGTHRKITTFAGSASLRTMTARSITSLRASGSFNVHRMNVSGGQSQQLTNFKARPVRFLTAARNGTLSFSYDGALYTMTPGQAPKKLAITLASDARATNERVVSVTNGASDLAVAPSGKEVAFIARGDVFVTSVEGGVTKQISRTPELERSVKFSPDGKALIYSSERGNKWQIFEARRTRDEELHFYASTIVRETPPISIAHENYQPQASPDGKQIAYIEDRMTLKVYDVATKQTRTLLTDQHLFSWATTISFSMESRQPVAAVRLLRSWNGAERGRSWSGPTARDRSSTSRRAASTTSARAGFSTARRCCGSATAASRAWRSPAPRSRRLRDVLHAGCVHRFRLSKEDAALVKIQVKSKTDAPAAKEAAATPTRRSSWSSMRWPIAKPGSPFIHLTWVMRWSARTASRCSIWPGSSAA